MANDDYFPSVFEIKGIGKNRGKRLIDAGYLTVAEVARANPEELSEIIPNSNEIIKNARNYLKENYDGEFLRITGIGDATAKALFEKGLLFPEDITKIPVAYLTDVMPETAASRIINYATKFVDTVDSMIEEWEEKFGIPYDVGRKLYLNGIVSTRDINEEALSYFLPEGEIDIIINRLSIFKDDDFSDLFSMFDTDEDTEERYKERAREAIIKLNDLINDYKNGNITNIKELNERVSEICTPLLEFHAQYAPSIIDYYMKKSMEGDLFEIAGPIDPISAEVLPEDSWPQSIKDAKLIRDYCEYCNGNAPPELEVLTVLQPDLDETELITGSILKIYQDIADDNLPESADYKTAQDLDNLLSVRDAFVTIGVPSEQAIEYAKKIYPFAKSIDDLKQIDPNIVIEGIPQNVLESIIKEL